MSLATRLNKLIPEVRKQIQESGDGRILISASTRAVPIELLVALGYAWEMACAQSNIIIHPSTPVGVKAESALMQLAGMPDAPFTKIVEHQITGFLAKADADKNAYAALTDAAKKLLDSMPE